MSNIVESLYRIGLNESTDLVSRTINKINNCKSLRELDMARGTIYVDAFTDSEYKKISAIISDKEKELYRNQFNDKEYYVIKQNKAYDPEGLDIKNTRFDIIKSFDDYDEANKFLRTLSERPKSKMEIVNYYTSKSGEPYVEIYYPYAQAKSIYRIINRSSAINESVDDELYYRYLAVSYGNPDKEYKFNIDTTESQAIKFVENNPDWDALYRVVFDDSYMYAMNANPVRMEVMYKRVDN